ncbi:MAG TPA: DUF885 domain-containing protein [Thermoanaerobaculia bacterium]|nr:DUF885 domain-containing protein [Thermoanaerobaculia bacterium]
MRTILGYVLLAIAMPLAAQQPLHKLADDYYEWSKVEYPVYASDQGDHRFDDRMIDYSASAVAKRRAHVTELLAKVNAMEIGSWPKDEKIDWILFRSQLESADFGGRVLQSEEADPQTYVGTASNAIFSLLKKEYDTPQKRAMAAAVRFRAMPKLYEQGKANLTHPVRLYAQLAIESARSIDPLFQESVEPLARSLSPEQRKEFDAARDAAIESTHAFADWLEKRLPQMQEWKAMGTEQYNFMLHHLLLLPMDAHDVAHLGEVELARYRALEAMLPDPSLAEPDPKRVKNIPPDQQSFLAAFQSREREINDFLREKNLITIPSYIGPFLIRQLPEAFKPTSPGGFMNPPGLFDTDDSGFYFIPTYDPASKNFYIRASIEEPRPILGHEGIPGHFLQISISNHLTDEIRREQNDTVFAEGWALYTEEMLMREGLYPANSAAEGLILRLSRYRAARIGVDVNLHTGKWTFEQGVQYFMEGGGLDREAATGEAAGSASSPTQKISYITGKWQIMRLLGKYRDAKGSAFRLGQFHDDLIASGSLPASVKAWLLLGDPSDLEKATGLKLTGRK